ncbi:hypothetical protein EV702DRAFT_1204731 [Suillus placidus]|uniref:Uncharacterized protein n=1 Tax=Suillus placidus TaxID=48579 RepID=A0A9P7CVA1_9AGAM|nr:hypothetical protein EV702DRAFT_1204731 [Suillus placidus]
MPPTRSPPFSIHLHSGTSTHQAKAGDGMNFDRTFWVTAAEAVASMRAPSKAQRSALFKRQSITDACTSRTLRANLSKSVAHEGSEIRAPVTGDEWHAVSAVRTHVFAWCQQRRAPRTCLLCNRQMHAAWHNHMPDLVETYLQWKHNPKHACIRPDPIKENNECETMMAFQITTVNITNHVHVQSVGQRDDELANVSLIRAGYLGSSPVQPVLVP